MNKEDVLKQEATEACLTPTQKLLVFNAMNEWARQAIAWMQEEGWKPDAVYYDGRWEPGWSNEEGQELLTEQVYDLFLQTTQTP